jgi:hypothetical protein
MLDADECITPQLTQEIAEVEPSADVAAYSISRRNWFCGRWVKSAGWWPDRLVRLFRTGYACVAARDRKDEDVHEIWLPQGRCLALCSPLDHFSYRSVTEYRRTFAFYTDLEAQRTRAGIVSVIGAWLIAPVRAGWYLVARGGLVEGWQGLYVCAASAAYPAVVATKAWTRARKRQDPS